MKDNTPVTVLPPVRIALATITIALISQRAICQPINDPPAQPAPAWGRFAGNTFNNVIENTWLPPSATTPGQTILRSVLGLLSRMGGNAWEEYWPDARRLLEKRFGRP